jgi:hypothetical protein
VPALLQQWPRAWRIATWVSAGIVLVVVLGYYLVLSTPAWRAQFAAEKFYPINFVGWDELVDAIREEQTKLPANTTLLADNFKSGAELGFALGDADIRVLDHPLNHKHGRAPQLNLWRLQSDGSRDGPVLLVVGTNDVQYKSLLDYYHQLCARVGPLPPPRVVNVDHGRQRFLLFALPAKKAAGPCTTPAFAWVDTPQSKAGVARRFEVSGWAFKDGVGLKGVDILLDGKTVAKARYGLSSPGTAAFWKISTDPNHPDVGFAAEVDLASVKPGRHWLGLRLHGADGSMEDWSEQPLEVAD